MPTIQGLLRRKGQGSDMDIRRHSFYSGVSASNPTVVSDGRASEQIPRRPSAAEFLSPDSALPALSITRTSGDNIVEEVTRSTSPPVQEETPKHHRFSMLKFRHASDSQLATRARLHAQNDNQPPLPRRKNNPVPCLIYQTNKVNLSSRDNNYCTYNGSKQGPSRKEEV